jgi:hypothetical protein
MSKLVSSEQERIAALKTRIAAEEEEKRVSAKNNLKAAQAAFDMAIDPEEKMVAERAVLRAYLIDGYFREKEGVAPDMVCECGRRKAYNSTCSKCALYRHALYGGEHWVKTGYCYSTQC